LVLGTIAGVVALHNAAIVHDDCSNGGCKPTTKSADDDARATAITSSVVSTVGFGVAAAGAALGTFLWLRSRRADARRVSVTFQPDLGLRGGGLVLAGRFE
jgi:hypothetical protein